jgi:hypothetical protein
MSASNDRMFSSSDLLFLLTFALGMGAFWLSGRLPGFIPGLAMSNQLLSFILSLIVALLVYGLIMTIWTWLVLGSRRTFKAALAGGIVAALLALATSLALTAFGSQITVPVAVLAFLLYLIYGIWYVIGWTVAKRFAR